MRASNALVLFLAAALAACGPQIGSLHKGEQARVVRALSGDTLELDNGLRVFLAEVEAPRGDEPYAAQSQAELEALALHRTVLLAYGGTRRWTPHARSDQQEARQPPAQTAIAHVFVQSEGGRWFWLQGALVGRGAVMVHPRRDNHARAAELLSLEAQARNAQHGLWGNPAYHPMSAHAASDVALAFNQTCMRGQAPYRIVQGAIHEAQVLDKRAALTLQSEGADPPFTLVVFGNTFSHWDGPPLASLTGARVRVRGALGVFHGAPQLCLDDSRQLEVLGRS